MKKLPPPAWDAAGGVVENARRELPLMAQAFFEAGAKAAVPGATEEEMHGFRLAGKHFRYTLEMFRPLYGPGLEKRISELREVQGALGQINDCATTRGMMQDHAATAEADVALMLDFLAQRTAKLTEKFQALWAERFGEKQQERWLEYLKRFARPKP